MPMVLGDASAVNFIVRNEVRNTYRIVYSGIGLRRFSSTVYYSHIYISKAGKSSKTRDHWGIFVIGVLWFETFFGVSCK
jgi:hypothetical protein